MQYTAAMGFSQMPEILYHPPEVSWVAVAGSAAQSLAPVAASVPQSRAKER